MLQIQQCDKELKQLRAELTKTEASINTIVSEMQKTETKNSKAKGNIIQCIFFFLSHKWSTSELRPLPLVLKFES